MANPAIQRTPHEAIFKALRMALLTTLILTISACGGGIFGTGDGSDTVDITTPPTSDAPDAGAEGSPPAESPAPGAAGDTQGPTVAFENLIPSGLQTPAPLIKIINQTETTLTIDVNPADAPHSTSASPGLSSPVLPLSLMGNTVMVSDPAMNTLLTINPLTAADTTLTTVIIRKPLANAAMNTNTSYLITSTLARPPDSTMSLLRLIQVSALDTNNQAAEITLSPDTQSPGSSELRFNNVDALTNPITSYQLVGAGQYLLSDSLDRFAPVVLTIDNNKVYTLLLTDTSETSLQVEIDSDVTIP